MKPKELLGLVARAAVGGVLVYAGTMKAVGPPAEFAALLQAYKIFPLSLITPLSIAVPYLEMWVGLFVLAGLWTRYASLVAALLFGVFLIVLGSALLRGIDLVSCGCFGSDSLSPRHTLIMDAGLLLLSFVSFKLNRHSPPLSLDRTLS